MKSRILFVVLAAVLVASLFAFGACAGPAEEKEVVEQGFQWPSILTISAGAVGTSAHSQVSSWTPLMDHDTGMAIRVVPDDSHPITNMWLKQGITDVMVQSFAAHATACQEARGEDCVRMGGAHRVRALWSNTGGPWGIMVRGDSAIKELTDIGPGTKVAVYPLTGAWDYFRGVLDWVQLPEDQITWVEVASWAHSVRAVAEGRADLCYITPSYAAVVEAAAGPYGVRFVPMDAKADPEGAARFSKWRPTLLFGKALYGIKEALGVPMLISTAGHMTTLRMSNDLAYNYCKWLDENYDRYKDLHDQNVDYDIEVWRSILDGFYLPLHEGAIQYMKDKGMWTELDDRTQAYSVNLNERYVAAFEEAVKAADAQKIKTDPKNEVWIKLWEDYKKQLGLPLYRVVTADILAQSGY